MINKNTEKCSEISYDLNTNEFGLEWFTAADINKYKLIDTKYFDKKISQVLIDGSRQSVSSIAILYLMEDGP